LATPSNPGISVGHGNAEVRVLSLFSLRHCFPVVGQLTHITDIMALFPGDVNGRMYIHRKIMNYPKGFHVMNVARQARNKVLEDVMERLPHFIGDGWTGQNHRSLTLSQLTPAKIGIQR
jgi:hypothetical protein